MISEKRDDCITIRTEVGLLFGNIRMVQKEIENGDVKKTSVIYLNREEMDALIEDYQSKEAQQYLKDREENEGSVS